MRRRLAERADERVKRRVVLLLPPLGEELLQLASLLRGPEARSGRGVEVSRRIAVALEEGARRQRGVAAGVGREEEVLRQMDLNGCRLLHRCILHLLLARPPTAAAAAALHHLTTTTTTPGRRLPFLREPRW